MGEPKTGKAFVAVQLKRSLGTRALLAECVRLMGHDDLGRPYPGYYVLHQALTELRDRLKVKRGQA